MKRVLIVVALLSVGGVAWKVLASGKPEGAGVTQATPAKAGAAPTSAPMIPVTAISPIRQTMAQSLIVTGNLRADEEVTVGSKIPGRITQVTVKEGDRVKRGQLLVKIFAGEIDANLAKAVATRNDNLAKLSHTRNQAKWKDTDAQSAFERAKADVTVAEAKLRQAETNARITGTETDTRVQAAKAKLAVAETNARITAEEVESRVKSAQANLQAAENRLKIVRDGARKQELRQAELAVQRAMVDMENSRTFWMRRQQLYKQDAVAKEEVDEAERRFRLAQATHEAAKENLDLVKEGARSEEVQVAERQVDTAREMVREAQAGLGQKEVRQREVESAREDLREAQATAGRTEVAERDVDNARAAVGQARAALRTAQAGLAQTKMTMDDIASARAAVAQAEGEIAYWKAQQAGETVRARVGGIVTKRWANVGELVSPNEDLLQIVAMDTVYFEAVVPELEVSQIREGEQSAEVTVDAMPGKKFNGWVSQLIPVADPNAKSFRVRISLTRNGLQVPAGGFARATIHVGNRRNALTIDKSAVLSEAGDRYVYVIQDGKAHRRTIQVGLVDDKRAEITAGLNPDDVIVGAGSPAIIDGSPVKAVAPAGSTPAVQ